MLVTARRLSHPDNTSSQMLIVFEDVTERRKVAAAKDILVAETRHRMGNLMAMLRAVVNQTEVEGRTGKEYRDSLIGRFDAVLQAQDFLSTSGGDADLATLVKQCLEPIARERAEIAKTPAVKLTQYQVQPLSMILHELATNAVKYGALSSTSGKVFIAWDIKQRDGQHTLLLEWREAGGPVVAAPTRNGFGTKLIDFASRAEGGAAAFEYEPGGLRVQIDLPIG